ncbi:sigma-70 family RNA polymerase sigma factor [uncultured Dokdonia sp.]|uniref:RNA polymerase sigma factor n=1 Tax=uncultured Dokdonia sp. TaxID=575653 RepID=UPI00261038D3|nr:sigma-70 family RNA polymerase sigma factor [uncultured Dokdonia sp.]
MKNEPSITTLRTGDSVAYQVIYEGNRDAFIAFASKYDLDQDAILDVYQESMIALYENIMKGNVKEFSSSIKTYLFGIGKFKLYEQLRAQKKLVLVDDFQDQEVLIDVETTKLTEQQKALRKHFQKLGERCRNILELFYLQGFKIKEIMTVANYENENTVKAQKSRCLKQLKTMMNPQKNG